jgi:sodium/proline symporter
MAIRQASAVPLARLVAMSWMVVGLYGAVFTGLTAAAYFGGAGLDDPETAFLRLIEAMFNPWVAGLLLAAVMAAIMSTVDSQLLVSSSALADDLYGGFLRPQAGDRERLWMSRLAVVLIAGVAIWLAANPGNRVLDLVGYAWAGFGAAFGPVVLLALYWPAMSARAALAGMLAGTTTVLVWGRLEGGIFDLYELLPAVIVATASIWAAHWLGR